MDEDSKRRTKPDEVTRDAERGEADAEHVADRPATAEEQAAADEALDGVDLDEVTAHAGEMAERGARQQGEGRPG